MNEKNDKPNESDVNLGKKVFELSSSDENIVAWVQDGEKIVHFSILATIVPKYAADGNDPAENGLEEIIRLSSHTHVNLKFHLDDGKYIGSFEKSHNANLVTSDFIKTLQGWIGSSEKT